MPIDGQGDLFDNLIPASREEKPFVSLRREDLLQSSYVISNVLLNVLIKRGIIREDELNDLLDEAWKTYNEQVRLHGNN
ncbi:hypothetical protein TCA2_4454 [Paenibacillus sp. TCA20]|uniref:Uncharacterized protein n=1 Tax=Paenibacillus urinalis TaxID=521520 RepID=A0ABY7XHH3_9BACL|nr:MULTISPECIES: hypothetical protein [Paenibacillus]WDI05209.1 hypothetical protein PUW25_25715 [Paenibacillus urinalis]GAK41962.1 hypothetical protein TCA2_4454 [Paenibacillus sp. TCA20]